MEIFISILSIGYLALLVSFFVSWKKIRYNKSQEFISSTFISVIIAVRDEEKNIAELLEDIIAQTYPASLFEVIIIDDHSTDSTAEIVKSYISKVKFGLRIEVPDRSENNSYKKKAIQKGITLSNGTVIITTDGDCRVGREWLSTIENFYQQTGAKFISSPVSFFKEGSFFRKIQSMEFASLIGTGAACLKMGMPNMCNGANIAYEKKVFFEVNGFHGNEHVPSGEDEFLMHKIFKKYPDKVLFLKASEAIVFTEAKETLSGFLEQRKRWASKWGSYTYFNIRVLALFIFLYNLSFLIVLSMVIAGKFSLVLLLFLFGSKMLAEGLFIADILRLSGQKLNLFLFLPLQILHPIYIVTTALMSRFGGYSWKGRKIK